MSFTPKVILLLIQSWPWHHKQSFGIRIVFLRVAGLGHIPYFAHPFVTSIDQEAISKFVKWRENRVGKPAYSALQTYSDALNLIFKEAIEQKSMIAAQVPILSSKGEASTRRVLRRKVRSGGARGNL